jgi:hypothetical protein
MFTHLKTEPAMKSIFAACQVKRLRSAAGPAVPPVHVVLGLLVVTVFMLAGLPAWTHAGAGAASGPGGSSPRTAGTLPNLPLSTLGGRQVWQDVAYHAGWRVQRHVWTGHHRLLDPDGWRRAWGGFSQVRRRFDALREDPAVSPRSDRLVILLHGWGRTQGMFAGMETALAEEGYDVLSLAYPSTRLSTARHAAALEALIADLKGVREVSFVTHSLGGIVLRRALAAKPDFENAVRLRRAVLIAAPNQGAQLAEKLQGFAPFHWVGGPVAAELPPQALVDLPAPSTPFITIAGARNKAEGWNPLLAGDDDGIVTPAETRLDGAQGHYLVPAPHTFIADHPRTIEITRRFLADPC